MAMDGGSVCLAMQDADGVEHTLLVPQHHLPANFDPAEPPGALILNGIVLDARGQHEHDLLEALRSARIAPQRPTSGGDQLSDQRIILAPDVQEFLSGSAEASIARTVTKIVTFVESDEYLELSRRHRGSGRSNRDDG